MEKFRCMYLFFMIMVYFCFVNQDIDHVYAEEMEEYIYADNTKFEYLDNNDGTITLTKYTGYTGEDTAIIVPSELDEKTVVELGDNLFENCYTFKKIQLPNTIIEIGDNAFSNCVSLSEINLETGLKSIGYSVFYNCSNLESIVIPDTVDVISNYYGHGIFENCSKLENIILSNSLTGLNSKAFKGCVGLKEIKLPDSLNILGSLMFEDCSNLENVILPSNLTEIGSYCFHNCTKLDNIIIPDSVTKIEDGIFSGCKNLKTITLSNNITEIPSYAFHNCYSLENIKLPSNCIIIGSDKEYGCFDGCNSIKEIEIPEKVIKIFSGSFNQCYSLSKITIPKNVTVIGSGAISSSVKVYGELNSEAYTFAKENGNKFIELTEHEFDEGTITKDATCHSEGIKTYSCKNCDEEKIEVIPVTNHSLIKNDEENCYECEICKACFNDSECKERIADYSICLAENVSEKTYYYTRPNINYNSTYEVVNKNEDVVEILSREEYRGVIDSNYYDFMSFCFMPKSYGTSEIQFYDSSGYLLDTILVEVTKKHQFILEKTIDATYTLEGVNVYKCESCGEETYETIPIKEYDGDVVSLYNHVGQRINAVIYADSSSQLNAIKSEYDDPSKAVILSYDDTFMTFKDNNIVYGKNITIYSSETGETRIFCYADKILLGVFNVNVSDHNYIKKQEKDYAIKETTCEENGIYYYACFICGEKSEEQYETEALGHTPAKAIKENEISPTCTECGSYDEVVYCSVCNEEISRVKKNILSTGHTPAKAFTAITIATCISKGSRGLKCVNCGEIIENTIEETPIDTNYHVGGIVDAENAEYYYTACRSCGKNLSLGGSYFMDGYNYLITSSQQLRKKVIVGDNDSKTEEKITIESTTEQVKPQTTEISTTEIVITEKATTESSTKSTNTTSTTEQKTTEKLTSTEKQIIEDIIKTETDTKTIVPNTSLKKLKPKKKGFKITLKKISSVDGYEIRYSTKKNFKGAKFKKVKKNQTSMTINKLKSKKKYYISVISYKLIDGEIYYSDWSKAKSVRTK